MSRERELLKGAVEWMHELKYVWVEERDWGDRALFDLIADINKIEELLAQPERDFIREIQYLTDCLMDAEEKAFGKLEPEQEPKIEFRGLRSNGDSYCSQEPVGIVKTIGGYPDQSEHVVELTCRHGDLKDGDLLYTASPTRERLSEDKLDVLAEANITDEGIAGYYLGFRDAEKAHGIGVDDER